MKLKKLILKNIASIEDAEILFDQAPLDSEPVFLICGDTGSGKTTILDGICLALYNETPRMNKTNREIYTENSAQEEQSKEFAINDCRQLMRRNTAEAWCVLEFTGSNEHEYRAEWYVARAHKRANGNLQPVKWSLEDLTIQQTWTKVNEIKQEIQQAVGLTFAQYCRTALLAQGDFTQFLQSGETAKSEILEKLTGTEIYSQIGAKIFALTREKKIAFEEQRQRLCDIRILSEEELQQILTYIQEQQTVLTHTEQQNSSDKEKLDWLRKDQELNGQIRIAEEKWQQTEALLQSDEIKSKEEILSLWTLTEEIRSILKQKQHLTEDAEVCRKKEKALEREYQRLTDGYAFLQEEQKAEQQKAEQLRQALAEIKELIPMYEKSQTLVGQLQHIEKQEQRIRELNMDLKGIDEELPKQTTRMDTLKQELHTQNLLLEKEQKEISEIRKGIHRDEYTQLQTELKSLTNELTSLSEAQKIILLLRERVEQKNKATAELEETRTQLTQEQSEEERKQTEANQKKLLFQQAEELFNKQKMALSDWAREMRHLLHQGDTCPVCGGKIESALHDEDFQSALAPLQQDLESKKQEKEQAERVLIEAQAKIKELNSLLQKQNQTAQQATAAYRQVYNQTVEICSACGIPQLQKNTQAEVDRRITENRKRQDEIGTRMKEFQKQINLLNAKQQEKDRHQQAADKLLNEANRMEVQINRLLKSKEEIQRTIQHSVQENETAIREVYPQILWKDREELWKNSRTALIGKLEQEAATYRTHTEQLQNLSESVHIRDILLQHIAEQKRQTEKGFPHWSQYTTQEKVAVPHLETAWNELSGQTSALKEHALHTEQEINRLGANEQEFYKTHPQISEEKIKQLLAINGNMVETYRQETQKLKDRLLEYKTELQRNQQLRQEHQEKKPELNEQDTPETLTVSIARATAACAQINQDIGRCQAQIENNRQNLEKSEALRRDIQKRQEEYIRWNRLCSLFGDDKGKKFRNIAQSFVLKELLERANFYLNHLTERYELSCQAGSLTILLTDWYQGGTSRPASTLSGGEGFLVSLSLALGLSSLNRKSLSVDTLFIDEGFGTLSSDYLNIVMDTLERLHQLGGKKVGIISHVEGLRERIKTQIRVKRIDQGRSCIEIVNENN